MELNAIQKLIIEENILDYHLLSNDDYESYMSQFDSDSLKEALDNWKDEIPQMRAKFKNLLRKIDKLDIKGDSNEQ